MQLYVSLVLNRRTMLATKPRLCNAGFGCVHVSDQLWGVSRRRLPRSALVILF